MFIALLKFGSNKAQAGQLMQGHNDWLKRGFDDGAFLMAGSLQPNLGGAILLNGHLSRAQVEERVALDPFVAAEVVTAEILEITPSRIDDRLKDLFA
ncbi:hypothetical protein [Bradyrhizobium sp. 2]|uniref:YciI family protein n=1 Tax=unclassified Bradyrhizobium TaxID=2631580 RepID=UPI001FF9D781|nr:hypothetical protein [Bradyrhizobium sp. 2]MCK1462959.1 hypothetical protein [Bradyrhizobium sp. 2]